MRRVKWHVRSSRYIENKADDLRGTMIDAAQTFLSIGDYFENHLSRDFDKIASGLRRPLPLDKEGLRQVQKHVKKLDSVVGDMSANLEELKSFLGYFEKAVKDAEKDGYDWEDWMEDWQP